MGESLDQWFAREILAHEAALTRYLVRLWPQRHEVPDLRQEIYVNVYQAALRSPPYAPKAFLFTAARNLMANRLSRNKVIFIGARADLDALNVLVDPVSPEHSLADQQEFARVARAFGKLPPRCHSVMWLRKVEQLPQKEVARRLGIREKAVEKQISRGVRLLARFLLEHGSPAETVRSEDAGREELGNG